MRRYAKASSAGSIHGVGGSRGLFRFAFATRGASCRPAGSGVSTLGLIGAIVLAIAALFSFVSSASASYANVGTFAGPGSAEGQLKVPGRAALEQGSGNLFVVDSGNNRVQVFKPNAVGSADYLTKFGTGELVAPWGIAIDQNAGQTYVYVADAGNDEIVKYDSDEAATPSFTVDPDFTSPAIGAGSGQVGDFHAALAVDPTTHELLVADTANKLIERFEADGTPNGSFDGSAGAGSPGAFAGPIDVAVNSTGDIYVIDATGNIVHAEGNSKALRYSSSGEYKATLGPVGTHERVATVTVNAETDEVLVSGDQDNVYEAGPSPFVPVLRLFDSANNPLPSPNVGESAVYDTVTGLAIAPGPSPRLYGVFDVGYYFADTYGSPQIQAFEETVAPTATIAAVDGIGAFSATLHGEVNPEGKAATCRFQYSTDTSFGLSVPCAESPGAGTSPVPVHAVATGLNPDTAYNVRLVATGLGAVTDTTNEVSFSTISSAPLVATTSAFALQGGTKALLAGEVNPENFATTYWFEYGLTNTYGTSFPAGQDANAGSGGASSAFTQSVAGLSPETTYHFRIVAHNSIGTTPGRDLTFTTTPASSGPPQEDCSNAEIREQQNADVTADCRAWEKVSPIDKNNLDAGGTEFSTSSGAVSPSGNSVLYFADGAFGNAHSSQPGSTFLATRTGDAWVNNGTLPAVEVTTAFGNGATFSAFINSDLSKQLVASTAALTPDTPAGIKNLYIRDNTTGTYELVSTVLPTNAPPNFEGVAPTAAAVTPDFEHVLFYSPYAYTSDAPTAVGFNLNLYEWEAGNPELRLVGYLPPDESVASGGVYLGGESNGSFSGSGRNALSDDGSLVYFNVPGGASYLREDGSSTKQVSESGEFVTATPSGSKALFIDDDGVEIYDAVSETTTNVSPDNAPADGSAPGVEGIVGNSEDLSTVYFIALRQLLPNEGSSGAHNLYVSNDGVVSFIGIVGASGDSPGAEIAYESALAYDAKYPLNGNKDTSPDGQMLAFASARQLTAYDNTSHSEIYVYDNQTGQLTCPSCRPDGSAAQGNAVLSGNNAVHGTGSFANSDFPRSNFTDDGTLFFQTTDSLSPDDSNGTTDIYEWTEGRAHLVTPGTGGDFEGYLFKGASPSGDDVFFSTRNRLVGIDTDDLGDIYDARVEGGIASQSGTAAIAACEGEQCRSSSSTAPAELAPTSNIISGSKNATPPKHENKKHKKKHHKKNKKSGKKHHKKHKASHRAQANG